MHAVHEGLEQDDPRRLGGGASISSHSSTVTPMGFSQSTCLPAASAASTGSRWQGWGVATYTASTAGSAKSAS